MSRRLLNKREVAKKLGYSSAWFSDHRKTLEASGFPPPVMGGGIGQSHRWDEYAIDLWFNTKMPADLQAQNGRINMNQIKTADISKRLSQRAAELQMA